MANPQTSAQPEPRPVTRPAPRPLPAPFELSLPYALGQVRRGLSRRDTLPPGPRGIDLRALFRLVDDPLPLLLDCHDRYGPVFTIPGLGLSVVFMLGPEANHYVTVENAANFSWREGIFGGGTPLIGDGLITTDGEYHDRARKIMMPAFHARRMDSALDLVVEETQRALADWRPGGTVKVYDWIRELSLRISMRALLGLDPDEGDAAHEGARQFEKGLSQVGGLRGLMMVLRGPMTPWTKSIQARKALDEIIYAQIDRRRQVRDADATDILAMLLDARDEDSLGFTRRELRDHVATLMFGGHDTSSTTLSFMLYELARNPQELSRLQAEIDTVLAGEPPALGQLTNELPQLDLVLDETLRMYPPVWFGPRLALEAFEFADHRIPAGTHISYSSLASHRLQEVFANPDAFMPDRFTPEQRAKLPKGAYMPFGGGSRICIGKRFGQLVVKAIAAQVLQHYRLTQVPGHELRTRIAATLAPRDSVPMIVAKREGSAQR